MGRFDDIGERSQSRRLEPSDSDPTLRPTCGDVLVIGPVLLLKSNVRSVREDLDHRYRSSPRLQLRVSHCNGKFTEPMAAEVGTQTYLLLVVIDSTKSLVDSMACGWSAERMLSRMIFEGGRCMDLAIWEGVGSIGAAIQYLLLSYTRGEAGIRGVHVLQWREFQDLGSRTSQYSHERTSRVGRASEDR